MLRELISIYNKYSEIINYLIFGFLTTVITLVVYYLLTFYIFDPNDFIFLQIANVLSWIFGVVFAYITNKRYVFRSKGENIINEFTKFSFARLTTLFLDMLVMFIGVTIMNGNDKIIKVLSQIMVIVSNYLFSKIVVFKKG